jgi:predicted SnoaL-like aldol condensation-catalyzing enzyme
MQNIGGYFAASIRGEDCFYDALGTARVCHIDVRDIAAAAARVLLAPDTIGRAFELHGPEALTNEELASRISRVAGRPVRYVPLTPEQMLQGAIASGMPEERARPVVELYDYYRAGKGVGSDQALRELIGRAPRTVNTYLAEIAASFAKSRPAREEVALAAGFGGFPTLDAAKDFVRNHFEQFVNEKNIAIGSVNFAPDFMDHGADVPPGTPPGPAGAMQYVGNALKKFPDMRVTIEDMVAEGDRVVVRNVWTATEPLQNKRISFRGIVIWRLSNRQLAERWAFLESPRPA